MAEVKVVREIEAVIEIMAVCTTIVLCAIMVEWETVAVIDNFYNLFFKIINGFSKNAATIIY